MRSGSSCAYVLGGGVAGITAAFELVDRGYAVELIEPRRRLGGRVFSIDDARMAAVIDNGPHVILGCYDRFRRLLRRLGTESVFVQPRALQMVYRESGGRRSALALSAWPTPLAMPAALWRLRDLTLGERLRALRGMLSSIRGAPASWSVEQWLVARGQHGGPRRFLWDPLCLAIMNVQPRDASAGLFLRTLRRAFGGGAASAALWGARAPWSEVVGEPALRGLQAAGVQVHLGRRATALTQVGDRVTAVGLADGDALELGERDLVVSALPWNRFAALLPAGDAGAVKQFVGRGIVNAYFDCDDGQALPDDGLLTALVDGDPFQFVYRRPGDPSSRFALIASASDSLDGVSVAEIEQQARAQLARYYPGLTLPATARVRVTKEAAATLVPDPAVVRDRPAAGPWPGLRNLLVCGDWTQTGLPSTLEGAAESASRMVRAAP